MYNNHFIWPAMRQFTLAKWYKITQNFIYVPTNFEYYEDSPIHDTLSPSTGTHICSRFNGSSGSDVSMYATASASFILSVKSSMPVKFCRFWRIKNCLSTRLVESLVSFPFPLNWLSLIRSSSLMISPSSTICSSSSVYLAKIKIKLLFQKEKKCPWNLFLFCIDLLFTEK